ncbi:F0F1 ATP synthase subunit A [Spelaeicoccus albus]|uniref:ATP synthase subunit a n=2 Tax=Spelaeicoccus albus TaxID=1280376 RepID=A0A7Z0IIZ5_9MICO|nr:F0F1 ATP synthase subunit A [Spelaeicoccus albus]NYI68974.1 F-type H+-transporting ATPase subunit a [Spelaeicoccus albus]
MHIVDVLSAAGIALNAAGSSTFHAPDIEEFFPKAFLFQGSWFEFNRIMLVRVIATVVICAIFWLVATRLKVVPSRSQSVFEYVMRFVRVSIAEETMGKKLADQFLPLITTIFFMVFAMNITGIVPFLNIQGTSVIGAPLLLAIITYLTYHVTGFKRHGFAGYVKSSMILPGAPPAMHILLVPIEFLTKYVIQPFTLTIRLLANMLVGHLLLVLAFAASTFLLLHGPWTLKGFGVLTFAGGFFAYVLEILIAILQAYIFALLAALYIQQAAESDH